MNFLLPHVPMWAAITYAVLAWLTMLALLGHYKRDNSKVDGAFVFVAFLCSAVWPLLWFCSISLQVIDKVAASKPKNRVPRI